MFLTQLQSLEVPLVTRLALLALLLGLVSFDVVAGLRSHRAFAADIAGLGGPATERRRIGLLGSWIRLGVASALVATLAVVALPGVSLGHLGLTAPDLSSRGLAATPPTLVGLAFGLLVGALAMGYLARKASHRLPGVAAVDPMLPRSGRGRWWWAGLSLSAGVTEEIVYRGLSLLTLALVLPDASPTVLVATSAVLFGLAHTYQGRTGVLVTCVAGWMLASLYVSTGSLLLPIVVHTLVDLRALMVRPRPEGGVAPVADGGPDRGTQASGGAVAPVAVTASTGAALG